MGTLGRQQRQTCCKDTISVNKKGVNENKTCRILRARIPWIPRIGCHQSSSRPSQSAPQSTPDHLDLPRVQKQLFWELFFQ